MSKNHLEFNNLKPLIEKSLENILNHPAHSLQTGPAIRKDYQLIEKQLLLEKEDDLYLIYQLFTR